MDILQRDEIIALFDVYGELLTDKQKEYFEEYYFDDLSLGEIAINHKVSRNAVFDQLKKLEANLINYESKLHVLSKNNKILAIIDSSSDELMNKIKQIIEE